MINENRNRGFTLIELLVVIAIIGILATIVIVNLFPATRKARDTKRKNDIAQIGRFLALSCFLPETGGGEYDINTLIPQIKARYPQFTDSISKAPKDPVKGNDTESFYTYVVSNDGKKCALYANLENDKEPVTLTNITAPTAGGGTGVLNGDSAGCNGTKKYFQYSN